VTVHEITHRRVRTNGIELHVAEAGPAKGPAVILCHGFPELWYSWRHQIPALAAAGFRVIAPDLRGYGTSDCPRNVKDYGIRLLTNDLLGLLDEAGLSQGTFVGHDWGALIVWDLARLHPGRVSACAVSVPPVIPPLPPTQLFSRNFAEELFYILYFQTLGQPEEELERDPRRTIESILWWASGDAAPWSRSASNDRDGQAHGFLDIIGDPPDQLPAWLRISDLDYYAECFQASGFFGPISYYRNLDANWYVTKDLPLRTLSMPIALIAGAKDMAIALNKKGVDLMNRELPNFRGTTLIEGAGHWHFQEKPMEANEALVRFLTEDAC
jgi:pimeloyl-ACP methyl ester carboxylesterase